MMKLTSRFLMIVVLVGALCISDVGQADLFEDLNLSDEQQAALQEIRVKTQVEVAPLADQLKGLHVQMEELVLAGEVIDSEAATELIKQIVELRSGIMHIVAISRLEAAQILTLEQREIVHERRAERQEKHLERREQRKGCLEGLKEWPDCMPKLF